MLWSVTRSEGRKAERKAKIRAKFVLWGLFPGCTGCFLGKDRRNMVPNCVFFSFLLFCKIVLSEGYVAYHEAFVYIDYPFIYLKGLARKGSKVVS